MNNYYVLRHLATSFEKQLIENHFIVSLSPHKGVWHAHFGKNKPELCLVFSSHPSETALFLDKSRPLKKKNVKTFFNPLQNSSVSQVHLAESDRIVTITFSNHLSLIFTLFGNRPNVFLADGDDIIDSFKDPARSAGQVIPKPRITVPSEKIPKEGSSVKKIITTTSPLFPRHLIDKVNQHFSLEKMQPEQIIHQISILEQSMLNEPAFRILSDGSLCLIPQHLLPYENLSVFNSLNEAVSYSFYKTSSLRRFHHTVNSLRPRLEKRARSLQRQLSQLEKALSDSQKAEEFEKIGHILMANAHMELSTENGTVTLPDYYNSGKPLQIAVDETITIAANAEAYYNRSARAERTAQEAKKRFSDIKNELKAVESGLTSFGEITDMKMFHAWAEQNATLLERLGYGEKSKNTETVPFRSVSYDGFEIWIGKNAKSNDKLTQAAHKEDLWLHARGVSGSHVVIRLNNRQALPPKHVILKAAAAAAYYSGARNSSLVPVSVTKRKYVTRPKGAAAGAVRVTREQVEMVEPEELK